MKTIHFKNGLFVLSIVFILFSCTSKEEKLRDYIEKEVVSEAENYQICQAILKFVHEDVSETFTSKINYYVNNPYYDYSYAEKYLGGTFMTMATASGAIKAKFDKRWNMSDRLLTQLWYDGNIRECMRQLDSNLTFKSLLKEPIALSLDDIADIYFKPEHMKFTEITPLLSQKIRRSILSLGAQTYKYDVVDEIRMIEKDDNLWTVDLVYHSGYCMTLEARYNNDNGFFFISDAPWLSNATGWGEDEVSGSEDELSGPGDRYWDGNEWKTVE